MTDYTPPTNNQLSVITTGAAFLAAIEKRALAAGRNDQALNLGVGDLVQTFLAAAGADSVHTARAYQTGVGSFLAWFGEDLRDRGELPGDWCPLATATKEGKKTVWSYRGLAVVLRLILPGTIDNFCVSLQLAGNDRATITNRRRAVASFLSVAYREGVIPDDQAQRLGVRIYRKREKRNEQPTGRRLEKDQVRALRAAVVDQARNPTKAARDLAIIDTMLFAGLRRDEVCNLSGDNFRQESGRWWLVFTGKGDKTRRVKLHDALYRSLASWCELRGLVIGSGSEPIFCNLTKSGKPTGHGLAGSVIGRLVAELGGAAGIAPKTGKNCLSPHDLRRTCARNAYDNGAPLPVIQTLLGHADIKTTMRYIGSTENDDQTAVDFVRY